MKLIHKIAALASLVVVLAACEKYEDFLGDFDFSAVYFASQKPLRTVVATDNMSFKIGVTLAGKRENKVNETATFELEPALLAGTPFKLLPGDYYTLSNQNTITIPAGKFLGDIVCNINKAAFTADTLAHRNTYAIPLRLKNTSADSILKGSVDAAGNLLIPAKDYTVIVVKYINPQHGNYYHKGVEKELAADGSVVATKAYSKPDLSRNDIWTLSTTALAKSETSGIGTTISSGTNKSSMTLTLQGNAVDVKTAPGSKVTITEGNGAYDSASKTFILNYKYTNAGKNFAVTDTLIYRNTDLVFEEW